MKGKYLLGGVLMALLGASIALFAYTHFIEKPGVPVAKEITAAASPDANAYHTAMQMQQLPQVGGQVDLTYAAEQTVHGVVHVHTTTVMGAQPANPIMEFFYGERSSRPREVSGYGSGVIITQDGYIITNNHVVEGTDNVDVTLNDNRKFTAKVVGRDPGTDIALLKINADDLPFIKYGDSDDLKLGEWVLAVGNPFNLTSTVTAGIVSAKGRSLNLNEGDYKIESFIQTDAVLNVGNSGGALVNTKGQLVGITAAILSPTEVYSGYSFSIPVNIVKKVVNDLKEFGEVQRAVIGVRIGDVEADDAKELKLTEVKGVLISEVIKGGSAEDAGLKEKDVIVKVDGVPVNTTSELQEKIGRHRPGDKATVNYIRSGKEYQATLVLKNIAGNTSVVKTGMTGNTAFGASVQPLSQDEKETYNVDYGVKVTDLGNGKFRDLGLPKGYIILSVNDKKVRSAEDIRNYTNGEKNLKSMSGIQPDGQILTYRFGN